MNPSKQLQILSRRAFVCRLGIAASGITILPSLRLGAAPESNGSSDGILSNPTSLDFQNELVRLKIPSQGPVGKFIVKQENTEIPYQVEKINGKQELWVCGNFAPNSSYRFEAAPGVPKKFQKKVILQKAGSFYLIDNGKICIKIPTVAKSNIPSPIHSIKLANGHFVGTGFWKTNKKLKKYSVIVVGDGTLFAKLRLRYDFEGNVDENQGTQPFAEFEIMLAPKWEHVSILERHEMGQDDYWEFVMSEGWSPNNGISKQFNPGPGGDGVIIVPPMDRPLLPIKNVCYAPDLYINLIPRWNQHFKDGWAFGTTDGNQYLSAVAVKASHWDWPHDNHLQCVVKPEGNYVGIRCSTWRGQRLWWLAPSLIPVDTEYIRKNIWENLDKINHEYVLEWTGKTTKWWSVNPYDSEQTNPTHTIRQIGKAALKNSGQPADDTTLIRFQTLIHPDCFGSYWNHFSPENPNFFTDYNLVPIALATNLKDHPQFERFRKLAENKYREDLFHSVTLPGGAGQECPGYSHYGMSLWREIVAMGEKHLNFDMSLLNPRLEASEKCYQRMSYPDGKIRRGSVVGDSHPDRAGNSGMPEVIVDVNIVKNWQTEELPGFGVIFTNKPGTEKETYLSFKSGPNRCHYHGDQLAFHYCANGRPLVVDHHCSYHPRAGQEHMHNRMAFFTDEMPYTNMDGYEHLLAVKKSDQVDIAVGEVESRRLRKVLPLPPEAWDASYPQLQFSKPLIYRRTVAFVKNGQQDYFVFRDQYWADQHLKAALCLHTYGNSQVRKGELVDFGKLTVFCNHPEFSMKNFDWSHDNGGREETKGIRLEISGQFGEMITVLYPGSEPPVIEQITGGVKVGDDRIAFNGTHPTYGDDLEAVNVRRSGKTLLSLSGKEIDFNRSQGEIGLFVPDAGYPFGDIPEWLAKQRSKRPEWAKGI